MTTPAAAAPANFDTTTIVEQGHGLEVLASKANAFLSLSADYQGLTYIYPGDAAVNQTRLQADIGQRFAEILHLSEEFVPNLISALLNNAYNNVMKMSGVLKTKTDTFMSTSKSSFTSFLASKDKQALEARSASLKDLINNLRNIGSCSVVNNNLLQQTLTRNDEIKRTVDGKMDTAAAYNSSFAKNTEIAEVFLNQTANNQRDLTILAVKDAQALFGRAKSEFQKNIAKEAAGGVAAWASVTTAYFPPITACPVDGKAAFTGLRITVATNQNLLLTTATNILAPLKTTLTALNTTLNTNRVSADTADAICTNLNQFLAPRPNPTASNTTAQKPLEAIRNDTANIIFTITSVGSLMDAAAITSDATAVTATNTRLATEYAMIQTTFDFRNVDLINYERLKTLFAQVLAKNSELRTNFPASVVAGLGAFYTATPDSFAIPNKFDFPADAAKIGQFVNAFKTSQASAPVVFDSAKALNDLDLQVNQLLSTASPLLFSVLNSTDVFPVMIAAMRYSNTFLRPIVDSLLQIDNDLRNFQGQNMQNVYQFVSGAVAGILADLRRDTDTIPLIKNDLIAYERELKSSAALAAVNAAKVEDFTTYAKSKMLNVLTSVLALAPIAPTAIANFVAPSASIVYTPFVLQFNHTNCFNITNVPVKETADPATVAYICPVDLRPAQYSAVPKILLSTAWATAPGAPPSNGVTALPATNPKLYNGSTNSAADGTNAAKFYVRVRDGAAWAFKEYTASIISVSKSLILVKVTLPVVPQPIMDLVDGNPLKDRAQFNVYNQFFINVTTTAT